ncbi:MAG: putative glycoside hydrolase [Spirochaetia bacterium]|nr:putative glycoside hydrolase [Spirochaetia bacterium]
MTCFYTADIFRSDFISASEKTRVHIDYGYKPLRELENIDYKPEKAVKSQQNEDFYNSSVEKEPEVEKENPSKKFFDFLEKSDINSVIIEKKSYVEIPVYTKGLYLHNYSALSKDKLNYFIKKAKKYKINTFVIDVQKKMAPKENIEMIKKAGIFPVARIVVFEGGLKTKDPNQNYINSILNLIEDSAIQGFQEIQLDYIRYADMPELLSLPLKYKYGVINNILSKAKNKTDMLGIMLSADVFGRITLNTHDHIGQRLENFGKFMDTIYPMVYPSHYTNDPGRISDPYGTVKEGVQNSKERLKKTRVVAYIQGFDMKITNSGLTMSEYVKAQIKAVKDARGDGWIIWNPRNDYEDSFKAMNEVIEDKEKLTYRVREQ